MSNKSVHVTPKGDAWKVKTTGSMRAARITSSQAEAIQIGRRIAMNNGYELVIHRSDVAMRSKQATATTHSCPATKSTT